MGVGRREDKKREKRREKVRGRDPYFVGERDESKEE